MEGVKLWRLHTCRLPERNHQIKSSLSRRVPLALCFFHFFVLLAMLIMPLFLPLSGPSGHAPIALCSLFLPLHGPHGHVPLPPCSSYSPVLMVIIIMNLFLPYPGPCSSCSISFHSIVLRALFLMPVFLSHPGPPAPVPFGPLASDAEVELLPDDLRLFSG